MWEKRISNSPEREMEMMRKSFETRNQSTLGYYNPITNPIPNYNLNPLIAKEKINALTRSSSKPMLMKAGNSIFN